MCKKKDETQKILNVFITHRHSTGARYIEKVRKLLDKCIEMVEGFDGYDLIYDRNVGCNYAYISELYNITDLDIFLISEKVDDSECIWSELQEMKDRGISIIPVRFEGFEGDKIREIIKPGGIVDALPIDLLDGKEPDEEIIQTMVLCMNQSLERYDRRKRDKACKKIMKKAKADANGYRISGWLVEKGKRIGRSAVDGAVQGAEKFAKSSSMWIVYVVLTVLLLGALGVALTPEQVKEAIANELLKMIGLNSLTGFIF